MTHDADAARTPAPVMGLYDGPMWSGIRDGAMQLQRCTECGEMQYPPAPVCSHCLSSGLRWEAVSGRGTIVSWVVFHRTYLEAYPAPYNVVAVRLAEGPVVISNLEGTPPARSWIGAAVRMVYATMADKAVLPRFTLDDVSAGKSP
jgi:uncharacterized OB-fold protein